MPNILAYKILTAAQFEELQSGSFTGAPIDLADGFIHLSAAGQVGETVAKHFAGQSGLIIAAIDLRRLGDCIKWEISRGGALFPHLYGQLTMAAVLAHAPLTFTAEGSVRLPG